jgi:hypothetical protein
VPESLELGGLTRNRVFAVKRLPELPPATAGTPGNGEEEDRASSEDHESPTGAATARA